VLNRTSENLFVLLLAESEGFEPPSPCGLAVFKTAAFDRSANSPSLDFRADSVSWPGSPHSQPNLQPAGGIESCGEGVRNMATRAWLFYCLGLLPTQVFAAGNFYNGNQLHAQLKDYRAASTADIVSASAAVGFVLGVHDAMDGIPDKSTGFCFQSPRGLTKGQVADIVFLYLEQNPQVRHFTGASLVQAALSNAYPCK
jgi:hypothetical protein